MINTSETTVIQRSVNSITFPIDAVTFATNPLGLVPGKVKLSRLAGENIEISGDDKCQIIEGYSVHSLLESVHLAFVDHRPLILSPDHLWLTICQGLVHYIRSNPELVRERTVVHEGSKALSGFYDDVSCDWTTVIHELGVEISRHTPDLHDLVMQSFSTTGSDERMALAGALLEMAGSYFGYNIYPVCGIPRLTLRGNPDDWERLVLLAGRLRRYGLGFWVDHLEPILGKFAQASRGDIDQAHWQRIYRHEPKCNMTFITGWIGKLFPYVKNGRNHLCNVRNPLLGSDSAPMGVAHSLFPVGVNKIDFSSHDGLPRRGFISGFVGTRQDPRTLALEPRISWGIFQQRDPRPIIERLRPFLRPQGVEPRRIDEAITHENLDMPRDLQFLYRMGDGGRVIVGGAGFLDILPFESLMSSESKSDRGSSPRHAQGSGGRFSHQLVQFGVLSDGSRLTWAQRAGGPEIIFVLQVPDQGDWVVAVTLRELVESLLDRSCGVPSVGDCLRKRKSWPF